MAYEILEVGASLSRSHVATVSSLDAAEAFLNERYDVIAFERDGDAADALVSFRGGARAGAFQYAVERV